MRKGDKVRAAADYLFDSVSTQVLLGMETRGGSYRNLSSTFYLPNSDCPMYDCKTGSGKVSWIS